MDTLPNQLISPWRHGTEIRCEIRCLDCFCLNGQPQFLKLMLLFPGCRNMYTLEQIDRLFSLQDTGVIIVLSAFDPFRRKTGKFRIVQTFQFFPVICIQDPGAHPARKSTVCDPWDLGYHCPGKDISFIVVKNFFVPFFSNSSTLILISPQRYGSQPAKCPKISIHA